MPAYHFTYPAAADIIREEGFRPSKTQVPKVGPLLAPLVSLTPNPDISPLPYN